MRELVLRVRSVRRATPSSCIVCLDLDGESFPYRAGQVASLRPEGAGERVPYSIASAPEETEADSLLQFLIKFDGNGRWGEHFEPLRRGARISVRGPSGSFVFPDAPSERRFLFIAGGTGIAPLRSMIKHAVASGRPGEIALLYSARTPQDFAYLPELRRMARKGELRLTTTSTREIPEHWRGARGRIAATQLIPLVDSLETLCFVCGPASMVSDVPPMLQALGIDRSRIRLEDW
ncbi:MAG: FAD-dependent oxidoreductase [Vicinamibacterales bacterium]